VEEQFIEQGGFLFTRIKEDIQAVLRDDPAAGKAWQVIFLYPGLHAIWAYRVAHSLYKLGLKFPALLMTYLTRVITGIEIHPAAIIGRRFFIDHGMGVVIGETTVIGNDCLLYQGVTLGGTGKQKGKRHPTLGNCVVVGSGAKILGAIKIGNHTRIGANSVVLHPVPDNSTVVGIPGFVVRRKGLDLNEALAHNDLPDPMMEALSHLTKRVEKLEDCRPRLKKSLKKVRLSPRSQKKR
jgi:serine O-acetyltransferase